jgi:hypothetical protein
MKREMFSQIKGKLVRFLGGSQSFIQGPSQKMDLLFFKLKIIILKANHPPLLLEGSSPDKPLL